MVSSTTFEPWSYRCADPVTLCSTGSVRRSTVLLASTIGFAVLYLAASFVLGSTPTAEDNGGTVLRWFQHNKDHVRLWLWLLVLALPLFAVFASFVRNRFPDVYGDVFFFGAIALAAETAVQGWVWAGLVWHAGQLQPSVARTLLDVVDYWGPVLISATLAMLLPIAILGLRRQVGLPLWLGVLAAVAVVEQLAETITIFGHSGFTSPGGPMNLFLGAGLTLATLVALGVTVALSMDN
jgi:hypothetical protein